MRLEGVRFGLEGEYMLADAAMFRPLWHGDLSFRKLNAILERIDVEPLLMGLSLDGLELDAPHETLMPYYVEGYGVPDSDLTTYVDVLPKGIEIRTPVCDSLEQCLAVYENLYQGLQESLADEDYRAIALAHHPTGWGFDAAQNHRRTDWWLWAVQVMNTYGPDLNISLPDSLRASFDWERLKRKVNYFAPALTAFSLASPVGNGGLWEHRGSIGYSLRTYRRSLVGPSVAYHPKEGGRLEFKAFDMPVSRSDFEAFFLLWLWLILDDVPHADASEQDRVYDLAAVSRHGWQAEEVAGRAEEALDRATILLQSLEVDPAPLEPMRNRVENRTTPADLLIEHFKGNNSIPDFVCFLDHLAELPQASATLAPSRRSTS